MEDRQNGTGSGKMKYSAKDYLCATLLIIQPTRNALDVAVLGRQLNTKLEAWSSFI
jgi:hypothetical protein